MLRGNFSAKIDDKGRLKIPTAFRAHIEQKYGRSLFVTSLTGESVLLYPMRVWSRVERKLAKVPSTHPSRRRYSDQVNFFGQPAEFDKQGRVLVHSRVREAARMAGEVDVLGSSNTSRSGTTTSSSSGANAIRLPTTTRERWPSTTSDPWTTWKPAEGVGTSR